MAQNPQFLDAGRGGHGHRPRPQLPPHANAPAYGGPMRALPAGMMHPQQGYPPPLLDHHPQMPAPRPSIQHGGNRFLTQQPNENAMTGNGRTQIQDFVKYGDTFYHILSILQTPTNNPNRMSNGVRVLRNTVTGIDVIEKNIMTVNEGQHSRAQTEISCLKQIRDAGGSPHLNAIYEAFWNTSSTACVILLEHCDRYTLDEHIFETLRIPNGRLTESLCWHVLAGMTAALAMLHYGIRNPDSGTRFQPTHWNTIAHLDIKPANVFMSRRMHPGQETFQSRVVLGDFGCAVTKEEMALGRHDPGILSASTRGWMAPEIKINSARKWAGPYGKPMDVWQMGGVIQVLCRLMSQPHQESADSQRPCGGSYSDELNSAIASAMTKEILERPTALDMWDEMKRLKANLASR